ncbi:hypothetical protein BJ085DRAFT_31429 [Dimargaris cristalligena]|uniref:UBX domain-containing protein n=1 Tax=Dimargaris cristalligena TaxID=215637 RepID=A0A4P9ZT57_9FUNG|nr:hypothetical protein BJ085DRAFT_31429 [Dimargaris cristalligena]|eukprot:RKP36011.1 hypothetical protein BJ085DRAFT_31429 [Dimargaris cristalligena]
MPYTEDIGLAIQEANRPNQILLVWVSDDSVASQEMGRILTDAQVEAALADFAVCLRLTKGSNSADMFGQLYPPSSDIHQTSAHAGSPSPEAVADDTPPASSSTPALPETPELEPNLPAVTPSEPADTTEAPAIPLETPSPTAPHQNTESAPIDSIDQQPSPATSPQIAEVETPSNELGPAATPPSPAPTSKDSQTHPVTSRSRAPLPPTANLAEPSVPVAKSPPPPPPPTHAQLAIRQLDGSMLRHRFSKDDTLEQVQLYIANHRNDGGAPYLLQQVYPHQLFDLASDGSKTLAELELCPSSTLVMKPFTPTNTPSTSSLAGLNLSGARGDTSLWQYTTLLLAWCFSYIQVMGHYLRDAVTARWRTPASQSTQNPTASPTVGSSTPSNATPAISASPSSSPAAHSTARNTDRAATRRRTRPREGFYTIHNIGDRDSDTDISYNGNSTNME